MSKFAILWISDDVIDGRINTLVDNAIRTHAHFGRKGCTSPTLLLCECTFLFANYANAGTGTPSYVLLRGFHTKVRTLKGRDFLADASQGVNLVYHQHQVIAFE